MGTAVLKSGGGVSHSENWQSKDQRDEVEDKQCTDKVETVQGTDSVEGEVIRSNWGRWSAAGGTESAASPLPCAGRAAHTCIHEEWPSGGPGDGYTSNQRWGHKMKEDTTNNCLLVRTDRATSIHQYESEVLSSPLKELLHMLLEVVLLLSGKEWYLDAMSYRNDYLFLIVLHIIVILSL